MQFIEVPDMNDSISSFEIDGVNYGLRFTYNELYDYWSFGLYDEQDQPIIAMTKVVPNFPLLYPYTYSALPSGEFMAYTEQEDIGRDSFKNGDAVFVYAPYDDEDEDEIEDEETQFDG